MCRRSIDPVGHVFFSLLSRKSVSHDVPRRKMAKTTKAKKQAGPLKKSTIEKSQGARLRALAKGRINPIGKKNDEVREMLLKWAEENPPTDD
mmetsp:Transcript_10645/g.35233  ORF Transcript_10645/g.35233 Transcript_10645/m.35233 type:complete len:92 (-) Transcript_10645:336-611(-)